MSDQAPSCCFIVNPQSAGGRTRQNWDKIAPAMEAALGELKVLFTDSIGSATKLCQQALDQGVELVISVGGDGTNNEVMNGFFLPDGTLRKADAQFAFIPMGSGGDLRRTLPHATTAEQMIAQIRSGTVRKLDVGKVTFQGANGQENQRFFLNITSIGISGDVNQRVNRSRKLFGGPATFFLASARAVLSYKNPMCKLQIDEKEAFEKKCHLIIVANGRYFGGGMKAAPDAEMDDGFFDLVILGDYSKSTMLGKGSLIYQGKHLNMPDTTLQRIRKLHLTCDREIWIDIDGEVPGHTPATIEIIPQVLPIRL